MYQRLEQLKDKISDDLTDKQAADLFYKIAYEQSQIIGQLLAELQQREIEKIIALAN